MARPPVFPVEDKFRIVVSVISGEMTVAEAARRGKVSERSISRSKQRFLEGGKAGLVEGGRVGADDPYGRGRVLHSDICDNFVPVVPVM